MRPERAKALFIEVKLLPFQGDIFYDYLPRALPWAMGFWALAFPSAADLQFSPIHKPLINVLNS